MPTPCRFVETSSSRLANHWFGRLLHCEQNADLGQPVNLVGVGDPSQRVRADDETGEQEADDRRHAQFLRHRDDRDGDRHQYHQIVDDMKVVHARTIDADAALDLS